MGLDHPDSGDGRRKKRLRCHDGPCVVVHPLCEHLPSSEITHHPLLDLNLEFDDI